MIRTGLHALLSHWARNKLQLLTLVTGIATATALWSGVQAINAEARASYDDAAQTLSAGSTGRIVARDGGSISTPDYVALRRAGWQVSPLIRGELAGVDLLGIEPLTAIGEGGRHTGAAAVGGVLARQPVRTSRRRGGTARSRSARLR